ncbi:MAG: response regulator [Defluviitaleaceae bacterium]|nr:response regulator [Defluviitaleaceae bacterium]
MRNILLVKDNNEIMTSNINLLKRYGGYNIYHATNIEEARCVIAATPLDITLLDINLPGGSGLDFLAEVRQEKNTPVLILSALEKVEDRI